MEISQIEQIFSRILAHSGHESISNWFKTSCPADDVTGKLRFVQYYIASQLGAIWHEEMIKKVDSNIILEQDFKNLNFLFPPPISDAIKNICAKDNISFSDLTIRYVKEDPKLEKKGDQEFDEIVALHRLSHPFLKLYKEKELVARQLVKDLGEKAFNDERYQKIVDRLNQGYSLSDLKGFISEIASYIHKGRLVSYFLDLYIDKGVVVPITCIKDGIVFRAFRHGEDVEFSENEMRLCTSMLEKFAKEYGSAKLKHTIVEKLLVLFIRIGIQRNFLTISTAPLSDFSSIGIRYYLHGAVVGSFDKKIYKTNMQYSLANVLEEAGYLERKAYKDEYTVVPAPTSGTDTRGLSDANLLGAVLGNLMKLPKSKLSLDELILVATIPSLVDAVGALAAEIYIFQGFYAYESQAYFPVFNSNTISKFRTIRRKKPFIALNSGTWKYENFKRGTAWKTIQNAKKLFDNEIYAEVWNSFWPSMGKQIGATSSNAELTGLFERLADWLYTTRFYINLIEIALTTSRDEFRTEPPLGEMQHILTVTAEFMPALHKHLKRLYDSATERFLSDGLKRDALYNYCTSKLKDNFQFARQLLAEVDSLASNFGKIERVVFCEHTVLIDFKKFNQPIDSIKENFNRVITASRYEAKKTDGVQFFEIPNQYSAIKTGIWVCASGKNARRWLFRLCEKLTQALDDNTSLKFTFFLNLGFFRICKRVSSNEYEAPLFWDIAKELLRKKFKLYENHELVYFTAQPGNKSAIESEIKNELSAFGFLAKGEKEFQIEKPYGQKFISNHFIRPQKKIITNLMDIGIITIVTPELVGVTDEFRKNKSFNERKGTLSARTYRFGTLKDKTGKDISAVVVQAKDQGNRSIISAYNALADEFNPQLIVLLGIGGSINKDVSICDVVIADSVFYYDKRAETDKGPEHRGEGFKIGAQSVEYIQNFLHAMKREEPELPSAEGSPNDKFKVIVGAIGTGEAVIKYSDAEERKWLLEVNSKTLAIETEAGGFGQQFYEDDLNYSRRAKSILVIRGISDKADIDKKDEWRLAASKNAMSVFLEIMKSNTLD